MTSFLASSELARWGPTASAPSNAQSSKALNLGATLGGALFGAGGGTPAAPSRGWQSSAGGFDLVTERGGKAGWVATKDGSTLEFELRFGASPRLVLTYLQSWGE